MKINVNKGYMIKYKKMKIFIPAIKQWIKSNAKYLALNSDDPPYAYNERATLSLFAASIWLTKGIALEEYCYDKERGRARKKSPGRIDLYVRINMLESSNFAFEAKQFDPSLSTISKFNLIPKMFCEVKKDIKEVPRNQGNRVMLIFITPYALYDKKQKNKQIERKIIEVLDYIKKINFSFCAWWFPRAMRLPNVAYQYKNKKYVSPGVIMIAKVLRQS